MFKQIIFTVIFLIAMTSCDVKKTDEGALPDVDVDIDAKAGELPEFDVDWAEVDVSTRTETVKVPKVVVVMEEVEVEVPYVDVEMPNAGVKEERTLFIEAEVSDNEHTMEIKEIWATGENLHVISELKATSQSIGDQKMRVSDQVTLNAPELNVKHYIIGQRPDRVFNKQHTFVNNLNDLKSKVENYKVIYQK